MRHDVKEEQNNVRGKVQDKTSCLSSRILWRNLIEWSIPFMKVPTQIVFGVLC